MAKAKQYRVVSGVKGAKPEDRRTAVTLLAAEGPDEAAAHVRRQEMGLWVAANDPGRLALVKDPHDPTGPVGREDLDQPYEILSVDEA